MKKNKTVIPDWAWHLYQAKQEEALSYPNDAIEETLNFLMRVFTDGDIPEHAAALERLVDNHLAGHRQKVRRRIRLLEDNADLIACSDVPINQLPDCVGVIQRNVTASQWDLLSGLANGDSYRQLSARHGLSVPSAKSTVCRIRKRLRSLAFAY